MNILVDAAMPNAQNVFSSLGYVRIKDGRSINADDLKDIDALFIRSVTKVNKTLLERASRLEFVGTATAGFDHVDTGLLKSRNIHFVNAPGSNKESVGDYVLSVLLTLANRYALDLNQMSIGIVGLGNTGLQVLKKARALGLKTVLRDLPLFDKGFLEYGASLEEILQCDFITLHVPLNTDGRYKTSHLIDDGALCALKGGAFLINASRGAVVDNKALLKHLMAHNKRLYAWLDVFEGEPEIEVKELLPYLEGGTAHIAGYSYESKRRASFMLKKSYLEFKGHSCSEIFTGDKGEILSIELDKNIKPDLNLVSRLVLSVYDVSFDASLFRQSFKDAQSFDLLRKNYRERHELGFVTLKGAGAVAYRDLFEGLGFKVDG